MLKYTEKRVIDDTDWDDFVKSVYKRPYKFQQQDGCKGRGIYSFSVPPCYIEDRDKSYDSGVSFDEYLPYSKLTNGFMGIGVPVKVGLYIGLATNI